MYERVYHPFADVAADLMSRDAAADLAACDAEEPEDA